MSANHEKDRTSAAIAKAKMDEQNKKLAEQNVRKMEILNPLSLEGQYKDAVRRLHDIEVQIKSGNIIERNEGRIPIEHPVGILSMNELLNMANKMKFDMKGFEIDLIQQCDWTEKDLEKARKEALDKNKYQYITL